MISPPRTARPLLSLSVLLLASTSGALAQTAPATAPKPAPAPATSSPKSPPPSTPRPGARRPARDTADDSDNTVAEVVVNGSVAQPGAVIGDIKPELQLTPADIRSYGVSNVTELLAELSPQTRSDRGRGGESPVVLLNGRRISGFNEVRDIPTEAIQRVDILPEEVGLKYGYTADQRVVNIVLRRRFRAITGEVSGGGPTEGGQLRGQVEGDLLHLRNDDRLNLDLKYQENSNLTERDRNVSQGAAGQTSLASAGGVDLASDRTLSPQNRQVTLNSVLSRSTLGGIATTVNGTLTASQSTALQGLAGYSQDTATGRLFVYAPAFGALQQTTDSWSGHLGLTLNKDAAKWRLSVTSAYDHADSLSISQSGLDDTTGVVLRLPDAKARSVSDLGNAQFLANGPLLNAPAGPLYASVKLGDSLSGYPSRSDRLGVEQRAWLTRNVANAQVNLDLPLASARTHVLGWLGELSVNGNLGVNQLSDFGGLTTVGYGVNWRPVPAWTLIVSHTHDEGAPSSQQLAAPVTTTIGARVFDYATGQTVQVTRLDGGNRALQADARDVTKVGLTFKPLADQDLTLTANYVSSRIRNAISGLPAATAEVEAAFPDRFVRDATGRLISIDNRPVNFASERRDELRWGVNVSMPLPAPTPPGGAPAPRPQEDRPRSDNGGRGSDRGGPGSGGFGSGGFGGARGPQAGRFQIAVYHTVYFTDTILVRPGVPAFDLLNGSAAGSGGGQPRHEVEFQLGYTKYGLGLRLSADWKSATTVRGAATGDLNFSDLATVNLRLFDSPAAQPSVIKRWPWLRGARIALAVNNLFDARQTVHDATGATPTSYQPAYLDPAGRVVSLNLRKLFF